MWKIIPDTNEAYSANSCTGDIKSNDRLGIDGRKLKGKILKPFLQNSGYLVVDLMISGHKEKHLVHRLIAKTFIKNYSESLDVNHIDGIKTNNILKNLECITRSENIIHAIKNGLVHISEKQKKQRDKIKYVSRRMNRTPTAMCAIEWNILVPFEASADVTTKYRFKKESIRRVANHKQNTSYGYKWKWLNKV